MANQSKEIVRYL